MLFFDKYGFIDTIIIYIKHILYSVCIFDRIFSFFNRLRLSSPISLIFSHFWMILNCSVFILFWGLMMLYRHHIFLLFLKFFLLKLYYFGCFRLKFRLFLYQLNVLHLWSCLIFLQYFYCLYLRILVLRDYCNLWCYWGVGNCDGWTSIYW